MIGKDTRTCRQEAKGGQCIPGYDCFVCMRKECTHPSYGFTGLSQAAPRGEEGSDLILSMTHTLTPSLPLQHLSPLLSVPSSVSSEICLFVSRTTSESL